MADVETMCCFSKLMCWIQLPGHLYAPQGVDLGGGGSSAYRNETLTGLAQVNIVKHFWYAGRQADKTERQRDRQTDSD